MASAGKVKLDTHLRALLALLLAWIVPGAGHAFIGRPVRGIIIFLIVGATFWTGVALGGVMTVDPQGQRWWFAAEMLTGVHGLIGWQREARVRRELEANIHEPMQHKGADLHHLQEQALAELNAQKNRLDQLETYIRTAPTAEKKEALRNESAKLMDAGLKQRRKLLQYQGQLNTLRSGLITGELSDKKLVLVAPVATVARAYAGIAGLLNLMCVFDAVMVALIGTAVLAKAAEAEDQKDTDE